VDARHVIGSNTVLVPVMFGPFTGTFTPEVGAPQPINDPAITKGSFAHVKRDLVECEFTITDTVPGEGTFTGEGSVTVFLTGKPM
jgi:hypothetical protein